MKHAIYGTLLGCGALALAACGGGASDADADGDGEVTAEELRTVAQEQGVDLKPQPGKYRMKISFIEADIPGAPPEMAQMMASGFEQTIETCVTQEQSDRGFEDLLTQNQDDSCKISKYTIDGNQVSMAMACSGGEMGDVDLAMDGTVGPTASDMSMTMDGSIPQMGPMKIKMNMQQERIGECDG